MREPLERRAKLFCKRELLLLRLSAERDAAVFVLTTILMRIVCEVGDFLVFPEKYSVLRGYRKKGANGLVLFFWGKWESQNAERERHAHVKHLGSQIGLFGDGSALRIREPRHLLEHEGPRIVSRTPHRFGAILDREDRLTRGKRGRCSEGKQLTACQVASHPNTPRDRNDGSGMLD